MHLKRGASFRLDQVISGKIEIAFRRASLYLSRIIFCGVFPLPLNSFWCVQRQPQNQHLDAQHKNRISVNLCSASANNSKNEINMINCVWNGGADSTNARRWKSLSKKSKRIFYIWFAGAEVPGEIASNARKSKWPKPFWFVGRLQRLKARIWYFTFLESNKRLKLLSLLTQTLWGIQHGRHHRFRSNARKINRKSDQTASQPANNDNFHMTRCNARPLQYVHGAWIPTWSRRKIEEKNSRRRRQNEAA